MSWDLNIVLIVVNQMYVLKHENECLETKSLYTNQTTSCDFVHSYDCMSNRV